MALDDANHNLPFVQEEWAVEAEGFDEEYFVVTSISVLNVH
jgi:hypothetical protein